MWMPTNHALPTPFDIIVEGKTVGLDRAQMRDKLYPWIEAGATWWIENPGGRIRRPDPRAHPTGAAEVGMPFHTLRH